MSFGSNFSGLEIRIIRALCGRKRRKPFKFGHIAAENAANLQNSATLPQKKRHSLSDMFQRPDQSPSFRVCVVPS